MTSTSTLVAVSAPNPVVNSAASTTTAGNNATQSASLQRKSQFNNSTYKHQHQHHQQQQQQQQQHYTQSRYSNNCNKFVPQAFNTNKCQQCFNLKESHSLEALAEFSKVNLLRIFIRKDFEKKYIYLFVFKYLVK